jgi:hypothetical protein
LTLYLYWALRWKEVRGIQRVHHVGYHCGIGGLWSGNIKLFTILSVGEQLWKVLGIVQNRVQITVIWDWLVGIGQKGKVMGQGFAIRQGLAIGAWVGQVWIERWLERGKREKRWRGNR